MNWIHTRWFSKQPNTAFKLLQIKTKTKQNSKHSGVYLLNHLNIGEAHGHTNLFPVTTQILSLYFHDLYRPKRLSDPYSTDHFLEPEPIYPLQNALFGSAIVQMSSVKHWAIVSVFLLVPVISFPIFYGRNVQFLGNRWFFSVWMILLTISRLLLTSLNLGREKIGSHLHIIWKKISFLYSSQNFVSQDVSSLLLSNPPPPPWGN